MLPAILSIALAIEKLVPFLTKLLDLAIAAREETKTRAEQKAKDARNAAAIAAATKDEK